MALVFEDTKKVSNKQIPIPLNAKKIFKGMAKLYQQQIDKNIDGSKILKSLANDKQYNKKADNNSKQNGQINNDSVSVNDAKVRLYRQNKCPKNSIQYQLYGGDLAHNILKRGIERARGVKTVDAVKPPKPTAKNATKPAEIKNKDIKTPIGKITLSVTESKNNKTVFIDESQIILLKKCQTELNI